MRLMIRCDWPEILAAIRGMEGPPKYELLLDGGSRQYILLNAITEEKVLLEPGSWELVADSDDDSLLFVNCEGRDSLWCDDLMEAWCFRHPRKEQQWMVLTSEGECLPLQEWQQRHTPHSCPIVCPGRGAHVDFKIFVLGQSVGGSRILWSISNIYFTFISSDMSTCGKWYQNWWTWWRARLSKGCLGDVDDHIRKPQATGQYGGANRDSRRFLHEPTATTHALVHLLVRWGNDSKSHRKKDRWTMDSWRSVLDGLVARYLDFADPLAIFLYADSAAEAQPGRPLCGSRPIIVALKGGDLQLANLVADTSAIARQTFAVLVGMPGDSAVPVADFLRMLDKAGRRCEWLFNQIVWHCASIIESTILESLDAPGDDAVPSHGHVDPESMLVSGGLAICLSVYFQFSFSS